MTIIGAIAFLGILLGLFVAFQTSKDVSPITETRSLPTEVESDTSLSAVSPTSLPSPTFPPLSRTIKSIDDQRIVVTAQEGDMTVPKDPDIVSVYRRKGDELIPATFDDVEVGQKVTVKIIIPGKKGDLIIEE